MRYPIGTASMTAALALLVCVPLAAAEPPVFVDQVEEHLASGDWDAARELLDDIEDPERPWADHYLGRIALGQADHDLAIEHLQTAASADSEVSVFHRWLGEAYIAKIDTVNPIAKLGLAKKAIAALQQAVELAPTDLEARDALVGFYLNAPPIAGGSKEKAAAQVAELKELAPGKGHALEGRLAMNEGDWAGAESAYRSALKSDPENAGHLYLVGFAQQQQERYDDAIATFEEAIELDPGTMPAYYQIGRTAVFAESHLARGAECLEAYLEQPAERGSPGHEHAWWRLGMVRELLGDAAGARQAYENALAIDSDHEEAKKALAALGG